MGARQPASQPGRVVGRTESGTLSALLLGQALADASQGGDKYQQAFYVFEELAQAPATASIRSLVSQAVCELHLGRVEEAQAALELALKKEPEYAEAIANTLVLTVLMGSDPTELTQ